MVGLWTVLGLPDTGRQRQDQDQDTGRPHADPHPPPAAGGSVPTRPWMINETCFWSRSGTDVEGREHLAPPACVVVRLLRQALVLRTRCFQAWAGCRSHPTRLLSPKDGAQREEGSRLVGENQAREGAPAFPSGTRPLPSVSAGQISVCQRRPKEPPLCLCCCGELNLFQGAGWALDGQRDIFRQEPGQRACSHEWRWPGSEECFVWTSGAEAVTGVLS